MDFVDSILVGCYHWCRSIAIAVAIPDDPLAFDVATVLTTFQGHSFSKLLDKFLVNK